MSTVAEAKQNIYDALSAAPVFNPSYASLFSDWTIQGGDVVEISSGNNVYAVPVYGLQMKWNGVPKVNIQATGNKTRGSLEKMAEKEANRRGSSYRRSVALSNQDKYLYYELTDEHGILKTTVYAEAGVLQTEISNSEQRSATLVTQLSNSWEVKTQQVVDDDGNITAASIAVAINDGESQAMINANKIYLLGQTIADTITANYINAKIATIPTMTVQSLVASDIQFAVGGGLYGNVENAIMNLQVVQNGNNYEIWGARFNGEIIKTSSFSRATSLSGAWASGVFTTTASPQGDTITTSLTNTGHWGNTEDNENPSHFYYKTFATIGSSPTVIDTGNVYEVDVSSKLQDKTSTNKFTANGTYTADSGYIGYGQIEIDVPQSGGATNVDVRFNGSSGSYYIEAFDSVSGNPITGANHVYQLGRSGTNVRIEDSNGTQISGTPTFAIPLETRSVTANGTYTPSSGKVGISSITVNVASDLPNARARWGVSSGQYFIGAYNNVDGNLISGSTQNYKLGVSGSTVQIQNTSSSQYSNTPTLSLGINSGSVNSSGSRTLTVTAGGSNTTATVTITDYATGYSAGQTAAGLSINGNGTNTVTRALSSSTKSVSITATAGISYNSSTHKYTATAQSKAGSTNMGSASATSGTEAYEAGATYAGNSAWFAYTSSAGSSSESSFIDCSIPGTDRYLYIWYNNGNGTRVNKTGTTWYVGKPDIFTVSSAGSNHQGDLTPGTYICAGYHRGNYGGDSKFSAYTWKVPGSGGASYTVSSYSGGSCPAGSISTALSGYTLYQTSGVPNSQSNTYRYIKFSVDGRKKAFYFS